MILKRKMFFDWYSNISGRYGNILVTYWPKIFEISFCCLEFLYDYKKKKLPSYCRNFRSIRKFLKKTEKV